MKRYIFAIMTVLAIIAASGCTAFTPPKERPVQQDYLGPLFGTKTINVFSLTPERRIVIVSPTEKVKKEIRAEDGEAETVTTQGSNAADAIRQSDKKISSASNNTKEVNRADKNKRITEKKFKFCAEPPPDVAESLIDTLRLLAGGHVKNANVQAELSKLFSSTAINLFVRSQGVQLFRDGAFNLCQAHINGVIGKEEYKEFYKKLLTSSTSLINKEIPNLKQIKMMETAASVDAQNLERLGNRIGKLRELAELTEEEPVEIEEIKPNEGIAGKRVSISNLSGDGFKPNAIVSLVMDGEKPIIARKVKLEKKTKITCEFEIPVDAAAGSWDLLIVNTDAKIGKLENGFEIKAENAENG